MHLKCTVEQWTHIITSQVKIENISISTESHLTPLLCGQSLHTLFKVIINLSLQVGFASSSPSWRWHHTTYIPFLFSISCLPWCSGKSLALIQLLVVYFYCLLVCEYLSVSHSSVGGHLVFFFLSVLVLMNKVATTDSLCVGACSHFILPLPRCRVYIHRCLIFQKLLSCFMYPRYHLSFPSNIWLTSSSQKVSIASLFSLSPSNGICSITVLFYSSQMTKVVDYHLCLLINNISF